MKILNIEVIPLSYVREHPSPFTRSFALVKVETDDGLVGFGESSDCYGHTNPLVIKQIIDEEFSRHLIGENPLEIQKITQKIKRFVFRTSGFQGTVVQALSGVEIALWDILGKVKNEPISKLLGEYRDKIKLYAAGTIVFDQTPEWHLDFYKEHFERGFTTLKLRIGNNFKWDGEFVQSIRNLFGDDIDIIVDGKYNYTFASAVKMAKKLSKCDVLYFEEPIPPYNIDDLSNLTASSKVPIAYGEQTYTIHGFRDLISRRAADVIQPDATIAGGLLECQKIGALAEAWNIPVSPHSGGLTAIGIAANLHHCASISNFTVLEYDSVPYQPLRDELLKTPIVSLDRVRDGCLEVPKGPGLGIEVDESVFAKYPYKPRGPINVPTYGFPHI
jgi:L-alanine-DL-glutamate epimerase-like enolase superfamily enzyme